MGRVTLLAESALPPGPRRDLAVAVHGLYVRAGCPSTRRIAELIREDDTLPGVPSHQGVAAAIRGESVSRWPNLESLVRVLVARDIERSDVESTVRSVHGLWVAAAQSSSNAVAVPQPMPEETTVGALFIAVVRTVRKRGTAFLSDGIGSSEILLEAMRGSVDDFISVFASDEYHAELNAMCWASDLSLSEVIEFVSESDTDELEPLSGHLMLLTASFRPTVEVVDLLAERTEPGSRHFSAAANFIACYLTLRPLDDALRLFYALAADHHALLAAAILEYVAISRSDVELLDFLDRLDGLSAASATNAVYSGAAYRSVESLVAIACLCDERGPSRHAKEILNKAAIRRDADDVSRLLLRFGDLRRPSDEEEIIRSFCFKSGDAFTELIACLRQDQRLGTISRILHAKIRTGTEKVALGIHALRQRSLSAEANELAAVVRSKAPDTWPALDALLKVLDG